MKTGVILYITGEEPEAFAIRDLPFDQDVEIRADRLEVISGKTGHYDIHNAWWSLQAKGVHRVICRMAEFTPAGKVRLTGKEMRLCG